MYLYGALVIDKKPFSRLRPQDQMVVRQVMEEVHQFMDERGMNDDIEFTSALLDGGIERVSVESTQIESWRDRVQDSNHRLAEQGEFSKSMLDSLEMHLEDYRSQLSSAQGAEGASK